MEGYVEVFPIEAGDFSSAGEASSKVKSVLKRLGVDSAVVRRVAVAAYEVELNLVIHSMGGEISIDITPGTLVLKAKDRGPGIENIELAMKEGYSTASNDVRMMGFGAGMGLPNMRRNADEFSISSEPGVGTEIIMKFTI